MYRWAHEAATGELSKVCVARGDKRHVWGLSKVCMDPRCGIHRPRLAKADRETLAKPAGCLPALVAAASCAGRVTHMEALEQWVQEALGTLSSSITQVHNVSLGQRQRQQECWQH